MIHNKRFGRRARHNQRRLGLEPLENRLLLSNAPIYETLPDDNDTRADADPLPLGFDAGEFDRLTFRGALEARPGGDRDWYGLELNAGDVLGVTVVANDQLDPTLSLIGADDQLLIFNDNHSVVFHNLWAPDESPLPRLTSENSKDSLIQYVINTTGTYYLQIATADGFSAGDYRMEAVVARPGMESQPAGSKQILFVDVDGETVNMSHLYGSGVRTLSPLSAFLPRWGLTAEHEDAVIDAILANIEENLVTDIQDKGLNPDFALEIRNSRDHADEFGINPYVARVILGGSRAEAGIPFFATAQFVDAGNFKFNDDALVTLDRQSAPAGAPESINSMPLNPRARDPIALKIELIGEVLGRQASHEAGHNFGNYHTDRDNDVPNVMDQAGLRYLAGRDGYFGTRDDLDIDFGVDAYADIGAGGFEEAFDGLGINDTLNTIAFGLTTPQAGAAAASVTESVLVLMPTVSGDSSSANADGDIGPSEPELISHQQAAAMDVAAAPAPSQGTVDAASEGVDNTDLVDQAISEMAELEDGLLATLAIA